MGCAKDIVEHVGVPRFLFSDFPLGNPAGRPNDPQSQAFTLELALRVLEAAPAPRTAAGLRLLGGNLPLGAVPMIGVPTVHPAFRQPKLIGAVPDPSIPIRLHVAPPRPTLPAC